MEKLRNFRKITRVKFGLPLLLIWCEARTEFNTQVNIDARGNQALVDELKKQIPLDDRIKLLEKLDSNGAA